LVDAEAFIASATKYSRPARVRNPHEAANEPIAVAHEAYARARIVRPSHRHFAHAKPGGGE